MKMCAEAVVVCILLFVLCGLACAAVPLADLPEAEKAMANDLDPWGLGFADQVTRFKAAYGSAVGSGPAEYVLGSETGLTKVFRTKYWFRGEFGSGANLVCAGNEHENLQIAVIPDMGNSLTGVKLEVSALVGPKSTIPADSIKVYRVGYVKTYASAYPVSHVGYWPDPLLPNAPLNISGTDLGLFWLDVYVPPNTGAGTYKGTITVSPDGVGKREMSLTVEVLPFSLPKQRPLPMAVWVQNANPWGPMTNDEFAALCKEYLDHGIDPVSSLSVLTNPDKPDSGDEQMKSFLAAGQMLFDVPRAWLDKPELMKHLREMKWMDKAIVYGATDEPPTDVFESTVVPDTERIRKMSPAPRVYLASAYHEGIDRGTDIWMTDLSTSKGIEFAAGNHGKAELWTYYCHLPINVDYNLPLVDAPNMLIDNAAIEHRLAYWIAWKYGAKGMFVWAGTHEWFGENKADWVDHEWLLRTPAQKMTYPYGGLHNGNGFLIYPGPNPSVRMKVLRDGMEDFAYLQLLKDNLRRLTMRDRSEALGILVVPQKVLTNPHYFSRNPQDLLNVRARAAALLVKAFAVPPSEEVEMMDH
jgi:hypothetical protein